MLRRELSARNLALVEARVAGLSPCDGELPGHEQTYSAVPSVVYAPDADGRGHGNFQPASYRQIQAVPAWAARLCKAYTGARRIARAQDRARRGELECANSSDALLMNVFCYPKVLETTALQRLLGLSARLHAEFGVRVGVPLRPDSRGKCAVDRTEVDLRVGDLLVEAKLTETGFQTAPARLVERYRDLAEVFGEDELQRTEAGAFRSYQLLRGVLAAHATETRFAVLCDSRRTDLAEQWFDVVRAVRSSALRSRLQLVTWQEIAATLPPSLRRFLAAKYGIVGD